MKLKTLKNFWTILPTKQLDFLNKTDVTCHAIRGEAIKYIKAEYNKWGVKVNSAKVNWIKYFFNIAEEDLKCS